MNQKKDKMMKNRAILEAFTDRIDFIFESDKILHDFILEEATDCLDSYDPDNVDFLEENAFEYFYDCIFNEIKLEGLEEFLNLSQIKLKTRIYEIIKSIK